jgi:hypothetical protein
MYDAQSSPIIRAECLGSGITTENNPFDFVAVSDALDNGCYRSLVDRMEKEGRIAVETKDGYLRDLEEMRCEIDSHLLTYDFLQLDEWGNIFKGNGPHTNRNISIGYDPTKNGYRATLGDGRDGGIRGKVMERFKKPGHTKKHRNRVKFRVAVGKAFGEVLPKSILADPYDLARIASARNVHSEPDVTNFGISYYVMNERGGFEPVTEVGIGIGKELEPGEFLALSTVEAETPTVDSRNFLYFAGHVYRGKVGKTTLTGIADEMLADHLLPIPNSKIIGFALVESGKGSGNGLSAHVVDPRE